MNKKVFLSKKFFVLWIFISIFSFCVFPEDKKNTETWQISPMIFSGKTEYQELIPKLILQAFPENITRVLTYEEQKIAYEDFIETEKEKLENKIQSLKTEKDQLFFKNTDANSKAKKRAEIESQIKELSEQLQKIEIENSFEYKEKDAKIVFSESFVKNENLLQINNKKDVKAILSGDVTEKNGFLLIKAKISLLPLNINQDDLSFQGLFSMDATTVGTYSDIQKMASELSQQFLSFIMNKEKVQVSVKVFPEELFENALITIDGIIYKNQVDNLFLQQGEHKISVEAPGYEVRNFTTLLEEPKKRYEYSVYLSPKKDVELQVLGDGKKLIEEEINLNDVNVYIAGIKQPTIITDNELKSTFNARKTPVLGEFSLPIISELEEDLKDNQKENLDEKDDVEDSENPEKKQEIKYASTFFRLTGDSIKPITIRTNSSSVLIEQARKRMYTSYGILLLTLPLSFYSNGRMTDVTNIINSGVRTEELIQKYNFWNTTSKISTGISISAGINLLIQLGRYIYAANTVLPQNR